MLLGLSVLLLTAAVLPAPASVCDRDNLWAEEVVLAELTPEAVEQVLTEDPDWGLLCPGAASTRSQAKTTLDCPGPSIRIERGRCELRPGGKARVFLRQRVHRLPGERPLALFLPAWRPGQSVGQAGPIEPDPGDRSVSLAPDRPHLPRPGPAGSLREPPSPPLCPGFQRGVERPPRST